MRLVTAGETSEGVSAWPRRLVAQCAAIIVPIAVPADPSCQGSPIELPCSGEGWAERRSIVLRSPYGARADRPGHAAPWGPAGAGRDRRQRADRRERCDGGRWPGVPADGAGRPATAAGGTRPADRGRPARARGREGRDGGRLPAAGCL